MNLQNLAMAKGFPFVYFAQDWELQKPEHGNIKADKQTGDIKKQSLFTVGIGPKKKKDDIFIMEISG